MMIDFADLNGTRANLILQERGEPRFVDASSVTTLARILAIATVVYALLDKAAWCVQQSLCVTSKPSLFA